MNYREVMKLAVERGVTWYEQDRMPWKWAPKLGSEVYIAENGRHVVDGDYGNLLTMDDGRLIVEGAPTVGAARTAAEVVRRLGL
jgi:hypothetical protein